MESIDLPWPPNQLMPNFKRANHWTKYRKIEKAYRTQCAWLTKAARIRPEPGLIPMRIIFFPPDRRRRDDDGIIGSFKNGRDGIADALGVDDNCFRPEYVFMIPIPGGSVRVEFL